MMLFLAETIEHAVSGQANMEVIGANPKLAGIDLERILTPAAQLRPGAAQRCVQKQARGGGSPGMHRANPFRMRACCTAHAPRGGASLCSAWP